MGDLPFNFLAKGRYLAICICDSSKAVQVNQSAILQNNFETSTKGEEQ